MKVLLITSENVRFMNIECYLPIDATEITIIGKADTAEKVRIEGEKRGFKTISYLWDSDVVKRKNEFIDNADLIIAFSNETDDEVRLFVAEGKAKGKKIACFASSSLKQILH